MVLEKFRAVRLLEKPEKKTTSEGRKQTQKTHLKVLPKHHTASQQTSAQNLTIPISSNQWQTRSL